MQRSDALVNEPDADEDPCRPAAPELVCDRGSLTQRLRDLAAPRPLQVRLLRLGDGRVSSEEGDALGGHVGEPAHVREVALGPASEAWVFARTVIPMSALCGPLGELRELGEQPLGEWLFARDDIRRGPLQVLHSPLPAGAQAAVSGALGRVWSRQSRFSLGAEALLVCEYFLPALWRHMHRG